MDQKSPSWATAAIRLRRLRLKRGRTWKQNDHVFTWAQRPQPTTTLALVLDTESLASTDGQQADAVRLLCQLPPERFEVLRTPGQAAGELQKVLGMEFDADPAEDAILVRIVMSPQVERRNAVNYVSDLRRVAGHWFGDESKGDRLIPVKAADNLGAQVFVTLDPDLLAHRDFGRVVEVMEPTEATALAGLWMRACGEFWSGRVVTTPSAYYWAMTRALTTRAEPGRRALNTLGLLGGDEEGMRLANSVFARLEGLIRNLDRMCLVWQFPADNDTLDELADSFDSIILGFSAIQDNLALLIGRYFGFEELRAAAWGLRSRDWRGRLRSLDRPAARDVEACLAERDAVLRIAVDLRDRAVHQAQTGLVTVKRERSPDEGRLRIQEPALTRLLEHIAAAGGVADAWGISDRRGRQRVRGTVLMRSGKVEVTREQPGEALLDPIPFATRLVAAIADLVDAVFELADFAHDPALTQEQIRECHEAPQHWLHKAESFEMLRLLGPFGGMGEWREPVRARIRTSQSRHSVAAPLGTG